MRLGHILGRDFGDFAGIGHGDQSIAIPSHTDVRAFWQLHHVDAGQRQECIDEHLARINPRIIGTTPENPIVGVSQFLCRAGVKITHGWVPFLRVGCIPGGVGTLHR